MGVLHQMGHHSENLLDAPELSGFSGAILSPVNYSPGDIAGLVARLRSRESFRTVFDPQLYFPTSERGKLRQWSYFPSDVDTADLGSDPWWASLVDSLLSAAATFGPSTLCSPAVVPRQHSSGYYSFMVAVCNRMVERLSGTGIAALQTAIVSLNDIAADGRAMEIASILTRSKAEQVYVVFEGATDPRRELADDAELKGAMKLIATLEESGMSTLIAYSSSDMLLWKAAGAKDCATGKFFNVRRFTRTRFEEPGGGGGQLPYWFEESLMAFLRESDVIRIRRRASLSAASLANPFGVQILQQLDSAPGSAWVALGWRQFMHWFADAEERIRTGALDVSRALGEAEQLWLALEDASVLMEEPRNNGRWLRAWRRALSEFRD